MLLDQTQHQVICNRGFQVHVLEYQQKEIHHQQMVHGRQKGGYHLQCLQHDHRAGQFAR